MTNKKIDIWLRFILYMLPFMVIVLRFAYYKSGLTTSMPSLDIVFNYLGSFESLRNTSFVNSFVSWFENNITFNSHIINVLYYMFYLLFVELCLLFKNVLVFIIYMANKLIERGMGIGK